MIGQGIFDKSAFKVPEGYKAKPSCIDCFGRGYKTLLDKKKNRKKILCHCIRKKEVKKYD